MPMPSLFKYFAFMGAALFGLLSLANFLLDPSTGATPVAAVPAKRQIVVQHDPRASKIERWRDDQAALKAAEQPQPTQTASVVTKPAPQPSAPVVQTAATKPSQPTPPAPAAQPAQPAQAPQAAAQPAPPPAAEPAPAASPIVGVETAEEAAAAAKSEKAEKAERKAKIAKAKARKERLARERDGIGHYPPRERYASSQQDQYYYGQRTQQQQPFATHYSSAFAPQQNFGPFGWGRGW